MLKKLTYKINKLTTYFENTQNKSSIYLSQKHIKFKISLEFIYENSVLNTLSFSDHFERREHCITKCNKVSMLFELALSNKI